MITFEVLERMALRLTLRLYGHLGRATQAAQYPRILEILREAAGK